MEVDPSNFGRHQLPPLWWHICARSTKKVPDYLWHPGIGPQVIIDGQDIAGLDEVGNLRRKGWLGPDHGNPMDIGFENAG